MPESTNDVALGATSRWTAAVRAMEDARPDRLFHDPWAEALAGEPDANHGRWPFPVYPPDMPGLPHNWLVTAHRA